MMNVAAQRLAAIVSLALLCHCGGSDPAPAECATDNGGCDPLVSCTDQPDGPACSACPGGYEGSGDTGCVDVDECAAGTDACDPNATCTNTPGGHTCACDDGYTGDGTTCTQEPKPGCDQPGDLTGTQLASFAPFAAAANDWEAEFTAVSERTGIAPYPPLVTHLDPFTLTMWAKYGSAWGGAEAGLFRPFGTPPDPFGTDTDEAERLKSATSLIVTDGDVDDLVRLTDFTTPDGAPRVTAVCEYYLARATHASVMPLRALCDQLGHAIETQAIDDLRFTAIKLLRARECGLPSLAYGHYDKQPGDDPAPLTIAWPDFLARDAAYRQPCVGVFVRVEARNDAGDIIGAGWTFAKAVADHAVTPFPFMELDYNHGHLEGENGAPRGEYVSTRHVFEDGVSLYSGTTPMWLLTRDLIGHSTRAEIADALAAAQPRCEFDAAAPSVPCVMPAQQPFLFPTRADDILWARQTLDGAHTCLVPRAKGDRNRFEQGWTTGLSYLFEDLRQTFERVDFDALEADALRSQAEQLGAMFLGFRLYQGGAKDFERLRIALVPLGDDYVIAIPDQGYFELGSPDPDTLARLRAVDLEGALAPIAAAPTGDELFTVIDVLPAPAP